MKYILAICYGLMFAGPALAIKVAPVQIEELIHNSESIVHGRIELGQMIPGNCGVRYVVRVEESYKGDAKTGGSVLFSSGKSLLVGSRYVLFLGSEPNPFDPLLSSTSTGPSTQEALERARTCRKNRPRQTVNLAGDGAFRVTGTHPAGAAMATFDDRRIYMPKGIQSGKRDREARYDVDSDNGILDFRSLRKLVLGGLPPVPSSGGP